MDEKDKQHWSEERVALVPVIKIGETEVTHRSVSGKRVWGRIEISDEHDGVPAIEEIEEDFKGVFIGEFAVEAEEGAEWNVHVKGELDLPEQVITQIVRSDENSFIAQFDRYRNGKGNNSTRS